MMRIQAVSLLAILLFTALSCSPGNGSSEGRSLLPSEPSRITSLLEPAAGVTIPLGEEIRLVLSIPDTVVVDSVKVFLGGTLKLTIPGSSGGQNKGMLEFMLATEGELTGKSGLRLRLFFAGGKVRTTAGRLPFFQMWCRWSIPTRW